MNEIIGAAKDLGRLIQNDEVFYKYMLAQQVYEDAIELQDTIKMFEEKRSEITSEVQKDDKNAELIKQLDKEVKLLYDRIIKNEKTIALNSAQQEMQIMLNAVNKIISGSASGLDPENIDYTEGCSPSGCAGCKGC